MLSLLRGVTALVLLLCPLAAAAAAAEPPEAPPSEDLEHLIGTLEDPQAREDLVRDLKVLLEADRQAAQENAPPDGGDVVALVRDLLTDLWDAVTSVDPRQVVLSALISLGIIIAALLLRWLLLRLLRRLYARLSKRARADEAQRRADEQAASITLPPTMSRLVNLVVATLAVALVAESWGAGLGELLDTDLGARLVQGAVSIGLILVVTAVLWNVSELAVTRLLELATGRLDRERTARRLDTLVPLLRSVLQVTIGVLSALLILAELGVNIGPLLAGAGILGLAVGFGAQTLVKDLITGVTILLEDSATVGDVVEVAGHAGVVEEMRIRVMQLRDLSGHVHVIPYSEVSSIINMTKDYSYYLMDIGIAYRENTDEVCEVLNAVCDELRDDEAFRNDIQEPLEILGVNRFADSAVEIRARIRTLPGRQWAVGREFNRRMKLAFDERGIEIPFPHTTVYFGEPREGLAPPARLAITEQPASSG